MTKARKYLLYIGLLFCIVSLVLMLLMWLFPDSYLIIALSNIATIPFSWGVFVIILSMILKKETLTKTVVVRKFIYIVLVLLLYTNFGYNDRFLDSFRDIEAVVSNNLYITEGSVIETHISRRSSTRARSSYYQYFKIDNKEEDEFIIMVGYLDDYYVEVGKTYKVISLPYARTVLEIVER